VVAQERHRTNPEARAVSVDILVFEDVEELDFVGPWEVFSVANRLSPNSFPTRLVSTGSASISARYGLRVGGLESLYGGVSPRVLILPGGPGRKIVMRDPKLLDHLRKIHAEGSLLTSVCTGAFVLAEAGLLRGKSVTTHWSARDELRAYPDVTVVEGRFVDAGDVVTSAGISAGIDVSLHLVERFAGTSASREVAHTMEYALPLSPFRPRRARG